MAESLAARAVRLQREVSEHKSAINYHRRALAGAKAALVDCEDDCRRQGIALIVHPQSSPHGEGDIHGRDDPPAP